MTTTVYALVFPELLVCHRISLGGQSTRRKRGRLAQIDYPVISKGAIEAKRRTASALGQPLPMGMRFSAFMASGRFGIVTLRTPLSNVAFTLSASMLSGTRNDL